MSILLFSIYAKFSYLGDFLHFFLHFFLHSGKYDGVSVQVIEDIIGYG